MREEAAASFGQQRSSTESAPFSVKFDAELRLQRDEAAAQPLFSDPKAARRTSNLPVARELHECRHLVCRQ